MIYLDHAATSWPKPPDVVAAMTEYLSHAGGNPGRSGHRLSIAAGRVVYETRELLAELFGAPDPLRVVLTPNVTFALNTALWGLLSSGDRVVTTSMEHNSVMRPLRAFEAQGLDLHVVTCRPDGTLDMEAMRAAVTTGTRLVVVTHASNVVGTILPIGEIADIAHQAGALLLVDAAQTAGVLPIDVQAMGIDLLAFTGHKGLQGPPGTGGLVIAPHLDAATIRPIFMGGTGSLSEKELQPPFLPDRLECGTINSVGFAGLGAGVRLILAKGVDAIRSHEVAVTERLVAGLSDIPGLVLYGPTNSTQRTATVSIRLKEYSPSEIGWRLDEEHDILCRVGLHCAPVAHRTLGTFPDGTVRLAPGMFTTVSEIDATISALRQIAGC